MRFSYTVMLAALHLSLHACLPYVPANFRNGEIIDRIILISDVDGVIRDNVESVIDHRVVGAIQSLIAQGNVDVTFLSGTPVLNDQRLEVWRCGNMALNEAFGASFYHEQLANRVSIYGGFGGQKLLTDGTVQNLESLSLESAFDVCACLLKGFLKQVCQQGSLSQRTIAYSLLSKAEQLAITDLSQSSAVTPREFEPIVIEIRASIDPMFRLLCNTCVMEIQISPGWNVADASSCIQHSIANLALPIAVQNKQVARGRGRRNGEEFDFILFGATNKGAASHRIIAEKADGGRHTLIVTLGDTQGDFPMHGNADLGFHVGQEIVWRQNTLPQCMMVQDADGADQQHVEGTLEVLERLRGAIGKSFYELKYIPRQSPDGRWTSVSLLDLGYTVGATIPDSAGRNPQ